MPRPLDPDVADTAPSDSVLTVHDEEHIITYQRLLDANAEGADWKEVARIVLHIDADREPARAPNAFESHLARAKWMTRVTGNCCVVAHRDSANPQTAAGHRRPSCRRPDR
jgi:hypothetical protein